MAAVVPKSIRGFSYRITAQDECDIPLTTPNRMLAGNGFINITVSPDVEEGDVLDVYLADGSLCISDRDDPRIKGWNITMQLCAVDALVSEMLIGGAILLYQAGDESGGWYPTEAVSGRRNSKQFEVWALNQDRGVCVTGTDIPANYVRWIMPRTVSWAPAEDLTFERNGHQSIGFTGYSEGNVNFTPVLGLNPAVAEGSGGETNNAPQGTAFDPDLNFSHVASARQNGGLGWIGSNTLPTFNALGQYAA